MSQGLSREPPACELPGLPTEPHPEPKLPPKSPGHEAPLFYHGSRILEPALHQGPCGPPCWPDPTHRPGHGCRRSRPPPDPREARAPAPKTEQPGRHWNPGASLSRIQRGFSLLAALLQGGHQSSPPQSPASLEMPPCPARGSHHLWITSTFPPCLLG